MSAVNKGTEKSVVVVGLDLSPPSRDILRAAVEIAERTPSELHLVHVLPLLPGESVGASRADGELAYASHIERAREELDRLATLVPDTVKHVGGHLRVGSADV